MRNFSYAIMTLFLFALLVTGCHRSWYSEHHWKAEKFFDDPKVIALCKAIEAKDLKEIDHLIADGADVNAKGKDNMTPLFWAFFGSTPEVFKKLLEYGADPNIVVTSDFNTKFGIIQSGDSVLYHAARTELPNYFKYVMQHGGNPNLVRKRGLDQVSPLMTVIRGSYPDKKESIQLLIDAGADLDYRTDAGDAALLTSVSCGCFSLTLQLLQAGASFNICNEGGSTFLHFLLSSRERVWSIITPEEKENYAKLLAWLEANGADLEGARKDNETGRKGNKLNPKRIAELQKRYEDELAAKEEGEL